MTEDQERKDLAAREARKARRPEITRWKKVLLGLAAVFVIVGGGLRAFGGSPEPESTGSGPAGTASNGAPMSGLDSGGGFQIPGIGETGKGGEEKTTAEAEASEWSPFFLKGGFSFFVAFCVGYAMRVWLKVSFLLVGTFFVGVFALSYLGALDVNWETIQGWYDSAAAKVSGEASDFKTFLTGSLPQAGLAGLGLVTGFKRK